MCRFTSCGWAEYRDTSSGNFCSLQTVSAQKCCKGTLRVHVPCYLASVTPGQQDQNGSWGDGGSQPPLVLAEGLFAMTQKLARNIFSGIVSGLEKENQNVGSPCIPWDRKLLLQFKLIFFEDFFLRCNLRFRNTEYFLYNYTTVKAETSSVFPHMLPVQHNDTNGRGQPTFAPIKGHIS